MQEVGPASSAAADAARAELMAQAIAELGTRARRYLQEPAEPAWHDLIAALARTIGDSAAYDLLRALEIRQRTSRG
jgi:hypothetical protein